MSLFNHVMKCKLCDGKGEYEQTYNAGCGRGYYRSMGQCDGCKGMKYRYRESYEPVPPSVLNQINVELERTAKL